MSDYSGTKQVGCCTCCDGECYEITERYPQGHVYEGQPRRVRHQYETAQRVDFLLSDGTRMDITCCDDCGTVPVEDYPKLWAKLLRSWARECDPVYRAANAMPPEAPEKTATKQAWLRGMTHVCILGPLYATKERRYHGERHECRWTHEGTHDERPDHRGH